jgi:membrane-associated phospholipid phosphatase
MTDKFFDEQNEDREPTADPDESFVADLDKEQVREEGLCPGDPDEPLPADAPYNLLGPQVEPAAAFWLIGANLPRVVPLDQVVRQFQDQNGDWLPDVPFPIDNATIEQEIEELGRLARNRHRNLDRMQRGYLSDFVNLQPPPFGAIVDTRTQYRISNVNNQHRRIFLPEVQVNTGGQLARMFEGETPGLVHRHALNWLLYRRADISPPRQARIWMALDVTIYSALSACWFFKWAAGERVSFRLRPYEYDRGETFAVLYDRAPPDDGVDSYGSKGESQQGRPRTCPMPSPGTPRHPAYPSGHSTYSAAASRILEYFFSPHTLPATDAEVDDMVPADPEAKLQSSAYVAQQLRRLANNIGEARLWGGVHWRSDHTFGQRVGQTVADLVIAQLRADCIPRVNPAPCPERPCEPPPTEAEMQAFKDLRRENPCPDETTMDQIPVGPRPGLRSTGAF